MPSMSTTFASELGHAIYRFRTQCGYSSTVLARKLGVTPASVSNWEKGANRPDLVTLHRMCQILSITPNDLLGFETPLTESDRTILERFHNLDDINQKNLIDFARVLADNQENARIAACKNAFLSLPVSIDRVCAGNGLELDDNPPQLHLYVRKTPETEKSDLIVQVTGDSMNPLYHDGDRVLLRFTSSIYSGEIGIFRVNGMGTIKQYGTGCLHPLNPDFPDIHASDVDEIICIGRVLSRLSEAFLPTAEEAILLESR